MPNSELHSAGVALPIRLLPFPQAFAMTSFRILTLGAAAISPGNLSQQPKRLALLAYLAAARPRGPHRRDDLIGLLWPDVSQDRARAALRQALHGLRKALGDDVIHSYGAELIELNSAVVSCDLWDLEQALKKADADAVARLYHPELLRGLFVSEAPELDNWIDAERRQLLHTVKHAFWQAAIVANRSERAGWIARAVALAPLDEESIRKGMALLAADGNLSSALLLFEALEAVLKRELDVEPSAATTGLVQKLRREHRVQCSVVNEPANDVAAPVATEAPAAVIIASSRPQRSSRWRSRRVYALSALTATLTTIASAAVLSSKFGTRDPRIIAVVSEFASANDSTSRARTFAATAAVRNAIAQSNLFTLLDSRKSTSRAGTIVRVGVEHQSTGYRITSSIVDRAGGVVRDGITGPVASSPDDAWRNGADRVTSALASALYPGWARAQSQPPSMTAYRAFVAGMDQIVREEHASAISLFLDAYRADSSFTAAGLLAGAELLATRKFAEADSLARAIAERRGRLPEADRALLEWLQYSLVGNRTAAFAAMLEVTRRAPSAELAWLQLATEAAEIGNPAEALRLLDTMRESPTFGERWLAYWANRAEVQHMLGNHQHELREVQTAIRAHPEMQILGIYELRARAALLDTAPLWKRLQVISETRNREVPITLRQVAMELRAHGDARGAMRALSMARLWYARQTDDTTETAHLAGVARTAFLQDDRSTARAMYDQINRRQTSCVECLGSNGVLAAREHNRIEALRVDSLLSRVSRPYLFGLNTLWRARIAATLGDAERARILYLAAREEGLAIDVLTHADADLWPAVAPADTRR